MNPEEKGAGALVSDPPQSSDSSCHYTGHTDLLHAALGYLRRGWSVIPVRHKPDTAGKQPAVSWRAHQSQRPTEEELYKWFANGRPIDGVAVILGEVSGGLVCRDFDTREGYEQWARAHPELAHTLPTVETARGMHVYFRSTWRGYIVLGDGELRGDSQHYCLLPPSIHPSGSHYQWDVPWPEDELALIDPREAGFLPETERTERTERTEETEEKESQSNHGVTAYGSSLSVLSVSLPVGSLDDDAIEAAIRDTQPSRLSQRNRLLFELARTLKAIPALAGVAVAELRDIVRRWHERALPVIGTKPFDETWADFVAAWPRVQFPKGQEPMKLIVRRADASPPPGVAKRYDAPQTRRLIAICQELQRAHGNSPFFLACRTAADLLEMDHATAWRRLEMLVADGVLVVVQSGTTQRATRYHYVGGD